MDLVAAQFISSITSRKQTGDECEMCGCSVLLETRTVLHQESWGLQWREAIGVIVIAYIPSAHTILTNEMYRSRYTIHVMK